MNTGCQTTHYLDDFFAVLEGDGNAEADEYRLLFRRVCGFRSMIKKRMVDFSDLSSCPFNLANLYNKQGRIQEAEAMYQRALEGV